MLYPFKIIAYCCAVILKCSQYFIELVVAEGFHLIVPFSVKGAYRDMEIFSCTLLFALAGASVKEGNVRETYFVNQLQVVHSVCSRRIKDIPDSYVAADDIEAGFGNEIPLWLFGFLY